MPLPFIKGPRLLLYVVPQLVQMGFVYASYVPTPSCLADVAVKSFGGPL